MAPKIDVYNIIFYINNFKTVEFTDVTYFITEISDAFYDVALS